MNDKNITSIISTNRDKVYTLESIPTVCLVYIERDGSLNQPRNK